VMAAWKKPGKPYQKVRSPADANDVFPVVEGMETPVRGLFVVMLVFAVTIGPVNLYLLARARRRIWMLWTVPLLALATCRAVFGYMVSVEGWHGHARTESLTVLDEASGRASTIGWTGFYTPLAPLDGLHFSRDTELTPQLVDDGRWGNNPRRGI